MLNDLNILFAFAGLSIVAAWCERSALGSEVRASPPSASTTLPGTQNNREVNVSSIPPKPTFRSASAGHFFPSLSGSDHCVTLEEMQ